MGKNFSFISASNAREMQMEIENGLRNGDYRKSKRKRLKQ